MKLKTKMLKSFISVACAATIATSGAVVSVGAAEGSKQAGIRSAKVAELRQKNVLKVKKEKEKRKNNIKETKKQMQEEVDQKKDNVKKELQRRKDVKKQQDKALKAKTDKLAKERKERAEKIKAEKQRELEKKKAQAQKQKNHQNCLPLNEKSYLKKQPIAKQKVGQATGKKEYGFKSFKKLAKIKKYTLNKTKKSESDKNKAQEQKGISKLLLGKKLYRKKQINRLKKREYRFNQSEKLESLLSERNGLTSEEMRKGEEEIIKDYNQNKDSWLIEESPIEVIPVPTTFKYGRSYGTKNVGKGFGNKEKVDLDLINLNIDYIDWNKKPNHMNYLEQYKADVGNNELNTSTSSNNEKNASNDMDDLLGEEANSRENGNNLLEKEEKTYIIGGYACSKTVYDILNLDNKVEIDQKLIEDNKKRKDILDKKKLYKDNNIRKNAKSSQKGVKLGKIKQDKSPNNEIKKNDLKKLNCNTRKINFKNKNHNNVVRAKLEKIKEMDEFVKTIDDELICDIRIKGPDYTNEKLETIEEEINLENQESVFEEK